MLRRKGGVADDIKGKVSHQGSQAGQGLPEVACVDGRPRHEMDKGDVAGD